MRSSRGVVLLALSLAVPACVIDGLDDDELAVGETEQGVVVPNGVSLNGMSLNGMSLNGMSLNGMSLNGNQLSGFKATGQAISGTGLVGALMNGQLAGGGTLSMRIDSASVLPAPSTDVWAYGVSYLSGGTWMPLCGTSAGQPILAIPVPGTWNYGIGVTGGGSWIASATAFTFGCRGAAIGKCVELGYKPWKMLNGKPYLRNHHQACTRMIRGDYCGNGQAWTANGTPINLFDNLAIQTDGASWATDAEWTPNGALCVDAIRDFQPGAPACQTALENVHSCGGFTTGALLVDEYDE
ncbi:MAG TPA: ADYC domain-containing protein [Kofleriaceae bacterium]|nr:ADYC domain-containing protein [Kofleriaceae bacterium]